MVDHDDVPVAGHPARVDRPCPPPPRAPACPTPTPMSIPSCILPQREPKPLVTGPATGQPSARSRQAAEPVADRLCRRRRAAGRRRSVAASAALWAARLSASARNAARSSCTRRARPPCPARLRRARRGSRRSDRASRAAPRRERRSAPPSGPRPAGPLRLRARLLELGTRVLERRGDPLVLAPDPVQRGRSCRAGPRRTSPRARTRSGRGVSDS